MSGEGTAAGTSMSASRALVLWCPDWPAVAALRHAGVASTEPAVVLAAGRVRVATASARAAGVRGGMRRRDAQSRCPGLVELPADPGRDARVFEPIAAAVEEIVPGIEVLRPGMLACRIRGPARYFGSETAAAERLVDIVEALDVECRIGVADGLSVAVLAARRQTLVPPGGDAAFCAGLPIVELARDPAVAGPSWGELAGLLRRLGIGTAGALAALPVDKVAARFGADGIAMYRLASGTAERAVARRHIAAGLSVTQPCDPALERVDTAAFVARGLADRFHRMLADAGLACTRLAITATTEHGEHLTRVWRCVRPLTAAATADRLRWQLDGWLTGRARRADVRADADTPGTARHGALAALRLDAIEAVDAGRIRYGLWGSEDRGALRAGSAFVRVQGLLGTESVLTATRSGGRGPDDRIAVAAWGEQNVPPRDPDAPWPGALPAPAPSRTIPPGGSRHDAAVDVRDRSGADVTVTGRGMLSGVPATVDERTVTSWAGPWLIDEGWWGGPPTAPPRRRAYLQLAIETGPPILIELGAHGWRLTAVYD